MADFRNKESEREFRRRLEELLPRPLRGDACASEETDEAAGAGGSEGLDQSARRRRRSDLEGDDLAESSAAARRHNRILSQWAARQAEEMIITNIERRNRESELMALARLHAVSMLDASFLRETRRAQSSVERPVAARAPSVLQRWRELEGESVARERRRPAPSPISTDNNHHHVEVDNAGDRVSSRQQSPDNDGVRERERERERRIVNGWMTDIAMADTASQILPRSGSGSPTSEWLDERERERVRLVREWMQTLSQHRDTSAIRREEWERDYLVTNHEGRRAEPTRRNLLSIRGRQARHDLIMRNVRERESELQVLSERQPVSQFSNRNQIQSVLQGSFLRIGDTIEDGQLHSDAATERIHLRQHQTVSSIREEFHSQDDLTITPESHSQSVDGNRNGTTLSTALAQSDEILDQFQARSIPVEIHQTAELDSEIPMESGMQNSDLHWTDSVIQEDEQLQGETEPEQTDQQQAVEVEFSAQQNVHADEPDRDWQENLDQEWLPETPEDDGSGDHLLEARENWHDNNPQVTETNWQDRSSDPFSSPHSYPDITNRFISSEDDSVYNLELQELLSRRSVSNLLHSAFRESLDHLVQSYIERQGRGPFQWDMEGMPNHELLEQDQRHQTDVVQSQQDSVRQLRAPPAPRPPTPPPPPLWHAEVHHSWSRQSIRRSEVEWDMINSLRTDMGKLQQVMGHMQNMLETCMDMQLELQRAVRQEVSAVLNRSVGEHGENQQHLLLDGRNWNHVRKGTCCVCCDKQIDSLIYRCGHMCTCNRCAHELVRGNSKCPLCRAPIVEVIRAYSIV
ncbi:uncharacterized protein LOC122024362 [Zingiber officinale]|uniref:RING-type domain-containing protein n=1 Tax=Zingiber officinale TaxID=94328 RepID=A0A8J5EXU0_ZINOF|nr:uncharacterized protein LOC122024362 [Zingiber officinale]XP_042438909.1 uncharacterized protein LOC122024362 [Zingiber officinale]KAG6476530.1 hypothetical protein ZIOFF_065772 [Zingiber officinale]